MAMAAFPGQEPRYVPIRRIDDFTAPFEEDGAYRTRDPWRGRAPSEDTGSYKAKARVLSKEDGESHLQSSEDDGSISEDSDAEGSRACAQHIIHTDKFKMAVAIAILSSTICIALETDLPNVPIWGTVNTLFLIFFVFELTLRLMAYRCSFFCNNEWGWNVFDFSIVLCSVLDQVQLDTIFGQDTDVSQYLVLLRMLRILRILRVLRLFHQCDQLMLLARGLMESMQMVGWITLLMFMFMLVFAIFLTDMVGNQAYKFGRPEDIEEYWYGVLTSINTLFQFLTLDNWSSITREVTDTLSWMRIIFNAYIFIAAFAMLSLLTGVVADHMTEVSGDQEEGKKKEEEEDLKVLMGKIEEYFASADTSGKLMITRQDFDKFIQNEELSETLQKYGVEFAGHEADDLWMLLDNDGDGWLTWAEFQRGILRLHDEKPGAKDLLRLYYSASRVAAMLEGGKGEASTLQRLQEVNDCMTSVDERIETMEKQLRGFMEFCNQRATRSPSLLAMIGGSNV